MNSVNTSPTFNTYPPRTVFFLKGAPRNDPSTWYSRNLLRKISLRCRHVSGTPLVHKGHELIFVFTSGPSELVSLLHFRLPTTLVVPGVVGPAPRRFHDNSRCGCRSTPSRSGGYATRGCRRSGRTTVVPTKRGLTVEWCW